MKYSQIKKLYAAIKEKSGIKPDDFDGIPVSELLSIINEVCSRIYSGAYDDVRYDFCVECDWLEPVENGFFDDRSDFVCSDCDNSIFWCEECQEYHRLSVHEPITVGSERHEVTMCEQSARNNPDIFYCDDCHNYFNYNHTSYAFVSSDCVCEHCLEYYQYCEECEEYTRNGCDCNKRSCHIKPYSTDAAKMFGFADLITRRAFKLPFVGIELECENSGDADIDDVVESLHESFDVVCCEDGSLNDGFEIKTRPENVQTIKPLLASIADTLHGKSMQSHNSGRCGLHVNLSRDGMTSLQESKIYAFFNNLENRKFLHTVCRRFSELSTIDGKTNYCRVHDFARYSDVKKGWIKDGKKVVCKNAAFTGKYSAVNFKENVLEIRLPRGTLKKSTLLANIDLCLAVVDWTRTGNNSISLSKKPVSNDFIGWLSKPENKKQYNDLWAYCIEKGLNNVDLMQVIV